MAGRQAELGSSLVEAAVTLPFLALVLFGLIDIGLALNIHAHLVHISREGALAASAIPGNDVEPEPDVQYEDIFATTESDYINCLTLLETPNPPPDKLGLLAPCRSTVIRWRVARLSQTHRLPLCSVNPQERGCGRQAKLSISKVGMDGAKVSVGLGYQAFTPAFIPNISINASAVGELD